MNRFIALLALLFLSVPALAQVNAPIPVKASALSSTPVTLRTGAGILQWGSCYNPNAAVAYIQVFDATSPSVGVTTPKLALGVPGGSTTFNLPVQSQYFTAIKVAATTTASGNTAPTTALDCNFGVN